MSLSITLPSQWIFDIGNVQYLNLGPFVDGDTLNSATPTYVNDLSITASLYLNRSLTDPASQPGTLISTFGTAGNLSVPYIVGSNGLYRGVVGSSLAATPGLPYVLVINVPGSPSGYQGHWEFPAIVNVRRTGD